MLHSIFINFDDVWVIHDGKLFQVVCQKLYLHLCEFGQVYDFKDLLLASNLVLHDVNFTYFILRDHHFVLVRLQNRDFLESTRDVKVCILPVLFLSDYYFVLYIYSIFRDPIFVNGDLCCKLVIRSRLPAPIRCSLKSCLKLQHLPTFWTRASLQL